MFAATSIFLLFRGSLISIRKIALHGCAKYFLPSFIVETPELVHKVIYLL